jgi:hypothetical protein
MLGGGYGVGTATHPAQYAALLRPTVLRIGWRRPGNLNSCPPGAILFAAARYVMFVLLSLK